MDFVLAVLLIAIRMFILALPTKLCVRIVLVVTVGMIAQPILHVPPNIRSDALMAVALRERYLVRLLLIYVVITLITLITKISTALVAVVLVATLLVQLDGRAALVSFGAQMALVVVWVNVPRPL